MKKANKKIALDYSVYRECLLDGYKTFGKIEDLPIFKKSLPEKIKELYKGGTILDFGSGIDKPIQKKLNLTNNDYQSLDSNPNGSFNYQSVDDITKSQKFSLIVANQVFEHIPLEESLYIFKCLVRHLSNNGYILLTTPNINHPTRQHSEITHITNWEFKSLFMLYKISNLKNIHIYRYSKRHPQGLVEKILAHYINKIYRIDWCDSILIIGQKNA